MLFKVTREKAPIYTMGPPPAKWITALYEQLINDNYHMLEEVPEFSKLVFAGFGMEDGNY